MSGGLPQQPASVRGRRRFPGLTGRPAEVPPHETLRARRGPVLVIVVSARGIGDECGELALRAIRGRRAAVTPVASAHRRQMRAECLVVHRSMSSKSACHCASESSSGKPLNAASHSCARQASSTSVPSRCDSIAARMIAPRSAASSAAMPWSRPTTARSSSSDPISSARASTARVRRRRRSADSTASSWSCSDSRTGRLRPMMVGDRVQRELERPEQPNGLEIGQRHAVIQAVAGRRDAGRRQQAEIRVVTNRLDRHAARSGKLADCEQLVWRRRSHA